MRSWLHHAGYWAPAWFIVSQPVGYLRGWYSQSVHWSEWLTGSMGYCALGFWLGYAAGRAAWRDRPALKSLTGVLGVAAFYAVTSIGR